MLKKPDPLVDTDAFAALPLRALSDPRLSRLHLCALGIIAWHDRRSEPLEKGAGCYASHKTLCREIGCHYTNLSTAISDLIAFGYLKSRKNPRNKWHRVYTVIYKNSLPIGKLISKTVCLKSKTVCLPNRQVIDDQNETAPKENLGNRTIEGIDFTKVTPIGIGDDRQKRLAIFERKLKSKAATDEENEACRALCLQIINDPHSSNAAFAQADRLLETYDELDPPEKSQRKETNR